MAYPRNRVKREIAVDSAKSRVYLSAMNELPTPLTIRSAAEAVGLSVAEMCKRAGVDDSTFWRWQNGKHSPKIGIVTKWMDVIREATP